MGAELQEGRFTTKNDEEIVVFVIGMRINRFRSVRKWLPVLLAMPPMIKELSVRKELGCLHLHSYLQLPATMMIQYWESEEKLLAYAKGEKHSKAWKTFNRRAKGNHAVGIYHETYKIPKESYESIYVNMPAFGLGKALGTEPVSPSTNTAGERLRRTKKDKNQR
ncbi:uncharacterized protein DUF4188 [Sinobaca qinghaiensis]|uniref:Uncharacterized protein DUF4188 n=1 Tax=Sinobaca qinghaiensis TaxID=342944 RepID=A0A419UX72_9BACL|nr:DUF4188 domain-containing protein [Sinobaca qinghaiensis]RKD69720.1 uncharacterized protein DUF4188 [Sinobaca qinghaiensis]